MYPLQMRNHIKYDLRDLYVHCACALCIVQCAYNYTVEGGGVLYWVGSVQIDEIDQLGWAGCTEHCTSRFLVNTSKNKFLFVSNLMPM